MNATPKEPSNEPKAADPPILNTDPVDHPAKSTRKTTQQINERLGTFVITANAAVAKKLKEN